MILTSLEIIGMQPAAHWCRNSGLTRNAKGGITERDINN